MKAVHKSSPKKKVFELRDIKTVNISNIAAEPIYLIQVIRFTNRFFFLLFTAL